MTRTHDSGRTIKIMLVAEDELKVTAIASRPAWPQQLPLGADRMMRTLGRFLAQEGTTWLLEVLLRQGSPAILLGSPQLLLVGTGEREPSAHHHFFSCGNCGHPTSALAGRWCAYLVATSRPSSVLCSNAQFSKPGFPLSNRNRTGNVAQRLSCDNPWGEKGAGVVT